MSAKAVAIMASLATISLGAATGWYYFQNNNLSESVSTLEQERTELRLTNQQLERDKNSLESRNTRLQQNLDQLSSETESTSDTAERLRERVGELETALSDREQERDELQASLDSAEDEIDAYRSENETLSTSLAEAEAQLAEREQDLATRQEEMQSMQDRLTETREDLAAAQNRLQGREETLAELNTRLEREQQALTELEDRLSLAEQERRELVEQTDDGATLIKLPERILYDTGSAELNAEASSVLTEIATVIESFPDYTISVIGHSDSRTISSSLQATYPTNWELSAARASAAVRELSRLGVDAGRMKATGVASTQPLVEEVDSNSRAQNRRIEIILEPPLDTEVLAGN